MTKMESSTNQPVRISRTPFYKYISILLISYIVALVATPILWEKNVHLVHSIMELICIFIALATFL
ncbi:MAG TPA: hypothetical protein VD757_00815, partial [Candidatus Nitrosocosmicus sp.]|nr:hypothetical protein [Candidatus Nitrosocosmicus sp.]